jgi:hypothetical protein
MGRVISGITTSLDGYITGPNDGPGRGLGEGGERLHYWVFGGPWSYAEEPRGEATGADKEYLDSTMGNLGAVIGGRWTYEAAEHWGEHNPWPVPMFSSRIGPRTSRTMANSRSSMGSTPPWRRHKRSQATRMSR